MELKFRPHALDRIRTLTIVPEYIEFDDNSLRKSKPTRFLKGEVEGIRYGIKWIRGYRFTIGRKYCIDLQGAGGKTIRIRLLTVYGIRKSMLHEKYARILNEYFHTHFNDLGERYLQQFRNENHVVILDTTFTAQGILIGKGLIPWEDVGTRNYRTYYAIFSKADPRKHRSYSYLHDWNSSLVFSFTRHVLHGKGLLTGKEDASAT